MFMCDTSEVTHNLKFAYQAILVTSSEYEYQHDVYWVFFTIFALDHLFASESDLEMTSSQM